MENEKARNKMKQICFWKFVIKVWLNDPKFSDKQQGSA